MDQRNQKELKMIVPVHVPQAAFSFVGRIAEEEGKSLTLVTVYTEEIAELASHASHVILGHVYTRYENLAFACDKTNQTITWSLRRG